MFTPIKIRQSPELTGKNICAMNEFSIRNIVQWLKDQDQEMYGDNMIE